MKAAEIMTARPEYLESNATLGEALGKLYALEIRHLPVVEKGRLVGMISDRDLRGIAPNMIESLSNPAKAELLFGQYVSDLMEGEVLTVSPEDGMIEILDLLIENKVGALPVVDPIEGRLLGIVSYIDVLKAVRDQIELEGDIDW